MKCNEINKIVTSSWHAFFITAPNKSHLQFSISAVDCISRVFMIEIMAAKMANKVEIIAFEFLSSDNDGGFVRTFHPFCAQKILQRFEFKIIAILLDCRKQQIHHCVCVCENSFVSAGKSEWRLYCDAVRPSVRLFVRPSARSFIRMCVRGQ